MQKTKSVIGLFMAGVLAFGGELTAGSPKFMSETVVKAEDSGPSNPFYDEEKDTTEWSYVYFGEYPQSEISGEALTSDIKDAAYDSNGDAVVNGVKYRRVTPGSATYYTSATTGTFYNWSGKSEAYFKYEPIRWRVLKNDGSSLFLLADNVLDCQQYQRDDKAVTWNTSNMRNWLNGYEPYTEDGMNFFSTAFSDTQREAVIETTVGDSGNVLHGTSGGSSTKDKVFLLSIKEVTNSEYGFPADFMVYSNTRRMQPSGYASAMGVWLSTFNSKYYGDCWWMLRSPGSYAQTVSMVYRSGNVYQDGYYAEIKYYGVCPALKIDIHSDAWTAAVTQTAEQAWFDAYAEAVPNYGDVNDDKEVTLEDAQEVLKTALGITGDLSAAQRAAADVDADGSITLEDAQLILKYALGIIDSFPVQETRPTQEPTEKPTGEPEQTPQPTVKPTEEPLVQTRYDASGRVWIAADSIAAVHGKSSSSSQPVYGWGELFADYFNNSFVLNNTALSSRSTKSFTKESNYKTIINGMKPGDYLLISFGHNDERPALELYTDPSGDSEVTGSFKWYLKTQYINPAIRAGVMPVLISPVVRRYFLNGELVTQLHTPYATAMEELKDEYAKQGITIYYIDLHHKMMDLYRELGEEGTLALHAMSSGIPDNTHFSKEGAKTACLYIIDEMKKQNMDICSFLKQD